MEILLNVQEYEMVSIWHIFEYLFKLRIRILWNVSGRVDYLLSSYNLYFFHLFQLGVWEKINLFNYWFSKLLILYFVRLFIWVNIWCFEIKLIFIRFLNFLLTLCCVCEISCALNVFIVLGRICIFKFCNCY